jgi:hypothetical protein
MERVKTIQNRLPQEVSAILDSDIPSSFVLFLFTDSVNTMTTNQLQTAVLSTLKQ